MNSSPRPSTSCHRPTLVYDWSHLTCWTLLTHWPRPSSAMPDNFTSLAPPHSPSPASSSIYSCSCPRSFIPRSYASLLTSSNLTTLLKHYSLHHCPPSTFLRSILLASLKACLDFYQFQLACRNISAITLKIKKKSLIFPCSISIHPVLAIPRVHRVFIHAIHFPLCQSFEKGSICLAQLQTSWFYFCLSERISASSCVVWLAQTIISSLSEGLWILEFRSKQPCVYW